MLKRTIDSQRASSRDSHQIGALDAQKFHQIVEILAIRIRLPFRNQPRIAKASLVVADDPVALCEDGELIVPRSSIQQVSMYEHEWMPCTCNLIIQGCAVYLCKTRPDGVCV